MNKGVGIYTYVQLDSILSKVSKRSFRYPQVVYKHFRKLINEYTTLYPYVLTLETDFKNVLPHIVLFGSVNKIICGPHKILCHVEIEATIQHKLK